MTTPFPEYRLSCGWNALLPTRVAHPPLREEQNADVVIVGAGFTGLACARRWQELAPAARIVILDASEIGEGNPGRNSGFLLEIALAEDADPANTARMQECNALTRAAMQTIVADVAAAPNPVDLQRAGTYRGAAGPVGLRALRNYQAFLEAARLPYRLLDQGELARELGTGFFQAGLYSPDCYLAQPAAVIRAIAERVPASVAIYEHTPALKVQHTAGKWRVDTPEGALVCDRLVLANNSFARNLGVARSRLAAVYTYAGITDVLSDAQLDSLGSNPNWGLLPTHQFGSTLRRTADGRLLVRSLHDYETEGDSRRIRPSLRDRLQRRFPQLGNVDFQHVWGGAVGFTHNGAPIWGEAEPGLFVSSGCNGGGTVKGTLLGRLLAEQANGETVPDIPSLFGEPSWMPPDPFRAIGFHATARLQGWKGRKEI